MLFRVQTNNVPGTRNAQNPHQHKDVPSVPGVTPDAHVCARNAQLFFIRAHINSFPRVHRRNTRNSRNNNVAMRISAVPGTRNVKNEPGTQLMTKPLRQSMPTVAAWIDELRDAFGAECINSAIRAGLDGQPTFFARENGQEVGTRIPYDANKAVRLSDTVVGPMNATAANSANRKGK